MHPAHLVFVLAPKESSELPLRKNPKQKRRKFAPADARWPPTHQLTIKAEHLFS